MKYLSTLLIVLLTVSLFGQEKGITPILKTDVVNGNTYAVVVGISDYQDDGIPDLNYADDDALAFAGFLQSAAGGSLDEDHLKVLINEEATVAQFAIALDWLWEIVKENDKVIIYFSGHGDVERKSLTQPVFFYYVGMHQQEYIWLAEHLLYLCCKKSYQHSPFKTKQKSS